MRRNRKLVRQQLDTTLKGFRPLLDISIPPKGWIRAIRDALGMSGRQLADRLHVSKQNEAQFERDEMTGGVALKTMRRLAESLDCIFVYGLVPRESLEQTVRDRAKQVAKKQLSMASQTMLLEDQALSDQESQLALSNMAEELAEKLPPTLWDES